MQRFRGGLVFKARRLLYHSTLGLRVIKQIKKYRLSEQLYFPRYGLLALLPRLESNKEVGLRVIKI